MTIMRPTERNIHLTLVYTTDVHGCFTGYDYVNRKTVPGGLNRVFAHVRRCRQKQPDGVILLDGGDVLQGHPTTYYYNYVDRKVPHLVARMMNHMGYDAGCMGNHDVETGHDTYDRWVAQCRFPVLGANVLDAQTGRPYLKPYTIVERQGVRIAVLGLTTAAVPYWLPRPLWSGLAFAPLVGTARTWMEHIRTCERPHIVVGLFHSGAEGGITVPGYEENQTLQIAREVPGFDLICCGHDHHRHLLRVTSSDGNVVPVISPSAMAWMAGEVVFDVTLRGDELVDKTVTPRLVDVSAIQSDEDADLQQLFASDFECVEQFANRPVGRFATTVLSRDAYFGPSPFVDLLHTMQLELTGADVSFAAALVYDEAIPRGQVYVRDMFNLYKYENFLSTLRLSGREIKGALEMVYDNWTVQMTSPRGPLMRMSRSLDNGCNYAFVNLAFNFDSAAGICYTVDVTQPAGRKIHIESMADGTPFDENRMYTVVTNSYRANGGGEIFTQGTGIPLNELAGRILTVTIEDIRYHFIRYIRKQGEVRPKSLHQWRFVPEDWAVPAIRRDRMLLFAE